MFELLLILAAVFGIRSASQAEPLGSIEGQVRDRGGMAATTATVHIRCGSVARSTPVTASGFFRVTGLPAGRCTVRATAAGFQARSLTVRVAAGSSAKVALVLVAKRRPPPPPREAEETAKTESKAADYQRPLAKPARRSRTYQGQGAPMAPSPRPGNIALRSQPGPMVMQPEIEHNTESYARIDDNPFILTSKDPLSTFSSDVDTASYSNLRRFLTQGSRPPKDAVRIEEMLNYFKYDYPQPKQGEPFSITSEVGPSPWSAKHQLVRIGIKAPSIQDSQVPARNLVFLLDVSGSMNSPNKLPLLKQGMGLLVETLRPQDKVSIVVYAGAAGLVLPPTTGNEKSAIRNALYRLEAGGSTNGGAGIQLAYEVASRNFIKGGINRVVLCTDGDYNVGTTNEGDLTRLIEKERERGVFLTVLGFGRGNYKDSTMEKLANRGNGNYGYIDDISEARKILVKEAGATLVTVAKDVKFQVEFNPAKVAGFRLIGYENRILRHQDFNDDKKDAGDIGAGHTVTALYEIVPAGVKVPTGGKIDDLKYQAPMTTTAAAASGELMTVKVRYKAPTGRQSKLLSRAVTATPPALARTSNDYRWAAAIAGFGMLLRESPHRGNLTWKQVHALAKGAVGSDAEGYRKQALEMIVYASRLKSPSP